ncbi:hypothetical protein NQZ68_038081 [Dissostichus eleginoides]|nr:hypothetical protein NQZ68_038081 [Dissostichus eleginoides]
MNTTTLFSEAPPRIEPSACVITSDMENSVQLIRMCTEQRKSFQVPPYPVFALYLLVLLKADPRVTEAPPSQPERNPTELQEQRSLEEAGSVLLMLQRGKNQKTPP